MSILVLAEEVNLRPALQMVMTRNGWNLCRKTVWLWAYELLCEDQGKYGSELPAFAKNQQTSDVPVMEALKHLDVPMSHEHAYSYGGSGGGRA